MKDAHSSALHKRIICLAGGSLQTTASIFTLQTAAYGLRAMHLQQLHAGLPWVCPNNSTGEPRTSCGVRDTDCTLL